MQTENRKSNRQLFDRGRYAGIAPRGIDRFTPHKAEDLSEVRLGQVARALAV